jgi:hypothetical protein
MAIANTTLLVRKSGSAGVQPSTLSYGELALNYADGKLYYKNGSGSIVSFASGGSANSFATINANSSLILATSNNDTLSIASGNNITITANTTSKTFTVGLSNNVVIPGTLTTGGGSGGNISGANNISANSFTANSTSTPVMINLTGGSGNQNAAILVTGANTKGGTGYLDFLQANNQSGSTTNPNKYFRISSTGELQVINSAYTLNLFNLDDSGNLVIPGSFRIGSGYIQFGDGTQQYTANAGGAGSSDTIARNIASAAYGQANAAFIQANAAFAQANATAGGLVTANSNITIIQGVDTGQNTRMTIIEGVDVTQNTNITTANNAAWAAYAAGNTNATNITAVNTYAGSAYAQANSANILAQAAYTNSNAAFIQANAAFTTANAALPKSGGTITGSLSINNDLTVTGNVNVSGNLTYNQVQSVNIANSIIYLAANNSANLVDIGIAGHFIGGTNNNYQHTGVVRNHLTGSWTFFSNVSAEPVTTINFAEANLIYDSITTGGVNSFGSITSTGLIVNGSATFGNSASQTVAFNSLVNSSFVPNGSNTYNFGSESAYWSYGYINTIQGSNAYYTNIYQNGVKVLTSEPVGQYAADTANTAAANTVYNRGVDVYQNTAITTAAANTIYLQGALNGVNTTITLIQSVDLSQNAAITAAYAQANAANVLAQAAFNAANSAGGGSSTDQIARTTANAAYIQANAAFYKANSGSTYIVTGANYVDYGWLGQTVLPIQFDYGSL